jgi:sigma-E factor negative regulatory protein RseB
MQYRLPLAPVAGALLFLLAAAAAAGQTRPLDARGWVQRMNKALVEHNYDGVFEERSGDRREVMRILHRFKDGVMTERVVSTDVSRDGSRSEQKRNGSVWAWFLPDKRRVVVATRNRSFGYIQTLNGLDEQAARHYEISDAGRAQMLGREVQMIHVEPKDNLRFGYRFWLDTQTALPLKVLRVAHGGKVVKEITFINPPQMPQEISDEQLKVEVDARGFSRVNLDRMTPFFNPELKRTYIPQAALMPAGFRSRFFGGQQAQDASIAGPRARYIVSDGVSWADVFVAPATGEVRSGGLVMDGLTATYVLRLDDVRVTVVGDMPQATARAIAEAVRPE